MLKYITLQFTTVSSRKLLKKRFTITPHKETSMKTSITITTLALTLILSEGCTTNTPIEDTTIISDKPIICETVGIGRMLKKQDLQDLFAKHQGKRIIFSTIGTICFQ